MLRVYFLFQTRQIVVQNQRVGARIDGKAVMVITHGERPLLRLEHKPDLAALEQLSVMIAQHRTQHLAAQVFLGRLPVDVEKSGVGGRLAVFEHVHPPVIVIAAHAHVVRNDVEYLSHAMLVQRLHETLIVLSTADLRIERSYDRRCRNRGDCPRAP